MADIKVGDTFWLAHQDHRDRKRDCEITVTKVGRIWAHFGSHPQDRFDMVTMQVDGAGYSPPGTVWKGKEDWAYAQALAESWSEWRKRLPWEPPAHLTMEQFEAAKAILNGECNCGCKGDPFICIGPDTKDESNGD